ncbi:MAG: hypothetical protein WCR46_22875, partial [Deltaproteobacteria bacterium]
PGRCDPEEKPDLLCGYPGDKEQAREFNLDRIQRFCYRTRYFTDSGIIGTKAYVAHHSNTGITPVQAT